MTRFGVIGNCQKRGFAHSLKAMVPGATLVEVHLATVRASDDAAKQEFVKALQGCDVVFTQPVEGQQFGALATERIKALVPRTIVYPNITFAGFHPDCSYFYKNEKVIETPTHHNSSSIVAGAFLAGLPIERVAPLFNAYTFASLGYFGEFKHQKLQLLKRTAALGFDLESLFAGQGVFMHMINHPKIGVLFELARQSLIMAGYSPVPAAAPEDELAQQVRWPVYPEIGQKLGLTESSLEFGSYGKDLSLTSFISGSYDSYARLGGTEGEFFSPAARRAELFIRAEVVTPNSIHAGSGESSAIGRRVAPTRTYRLVEEIAFGLGGNSGKFQGDGWSRAEKTFTWTNGPKCELILVFNQPRPPSTTASAYKLSIDAKPFVVKGVHDEQELSVAINGHPVHSKKYSAATTIVLDVPVEAIGHAGQLQVQFSLPDCRRPAEVLPGSTDQRLLGFAVSRVVVSAED